jgi:uncharacterized membrane protein
VGSEEWPSDVELLVEEGIDAALAGERARARDLLNLVVQQDRQNARAWLWLSDVVEGQVAREFCLQRVTDGELDAPAVMQEPAKLHHPRREQAHDALLPGHPGEVGRGLAVAEASGRRATEETVPAGSGRVGFVAETAGALATGAAEEANERQAASRPGTAEGAGVGPVEGAGLVVRNGFALIAVLGLVLLALIALGVEGLPAPLALLRILLGLTFVLFVPGYVLQAALFPRPADLDGPERMTLSFGLSVVVVPFLALILDQLPWGISLWPIIIGEGLFVAILSAVALLRRWRLPAETGQGVKKLADWWASQDQAGRLLNGVLAIALLLAAVLSAAILLRPKPVELFTEFYVLGPDGLVEGYPRVTKPGQAVTVTAGITNHEGQASEYHIVVQVAGEIVGGAGPRTLQDGAIWEAPVEYALPRAGEDQQVEFLLYRDDMVDPYRRLSLWIDVVEGGRP